MERIHERFAWLRERGEGALVPFVTAGDPDLETTEALVLALAEEGADLVELGVPFSDPIADGPTIQRASQRALASHTTLRKVLALVERLRTRVGIPLILMGYANPFYAMGAGPFAREAAAVGVDGIIVPDLPPEEGAELYDAAEAAGVAPILLAAPTTSEARLGMLAARTRGFLYYVSLTGVTSARSELASGIESAVKRARQVAPVPVCVGFGISRPEQAREVGRYADGVVVGSAIVDRIESAASRDAAVDAVAAFARSFKQALRPGGS